MAGSGFPDDKAFPTIRRGEIDYDGQVGEFASGIRSLRRVSFGVVLVFGVLAIVLAAVGRADAAYGVVLMIIAPLALILIIVEIVNLARRASS